MRFVSIALLGALGCAYGKCGLITLPLKTYKNGSGFIPTVSAPNGNATGICAFGALSMHEFSFEFANIEAKNNAIGVDASSIILTGGVLDMWDITSTQGNAYALYSGNNLVLKLSSNYIFWETTPSIISAHTLTAQNNAYAIYTKNSLEIKGQADISIYSLQSTAGKSIGISAGESVFEKVNLSIENISSENESIGIDTGDLRIENESKIHFGKLYAKGNATGILLSGNLYLDSSDISFDEIASSGGVAMGINLGNGGYVYHGNNHATWKESNTLSFGKISGVSAVGIYAPRMLCVDLREQEFSIKFDSITSTIGDSVGIYVKSGSFGIQFDNDSLDLGVISSSDGGAYGIVTDGTSLTLNLSNSTLSMSLQGNTQSAFYSPSNHDIDLKMSNSTLLIDGNGGRIGWFVSHYGNYIDLSGKTHNSLQQRVSSRELVIEKFEDASGLSVEPTLTISLYHDPNKAISDKIIIQDLWSYSGLIELDVEYTPLQNPQTSTSRYSLLAQTPQKLQVNHLTQSGESKYQLKEEGIEAIQTNIHRYDKDSVSYYYIDTQEEQIRTLSTQAIAPLKALLDSQIGSYFGSIDTLGKRMGDLREGRDRSGVWGRISFEKMDGYFAEIGSANFEVGVDFQKQRDEKSYLFGVSASIAPQISSNSYIQASNRFQAGIYGGVYSSSGWFYFAQIQGKYWDTQLSSTYVMQESRVKQWAVGFENEVGYRLDFGERGGFFLEPRAIASVGGILPTSYTQRSQDSQTISAELKAILALEGKAGGRVGYAGDSWDMYFGAYYSYKGLYGKEIDVQSNTGLKARIENFKHAYTSLVFDLGTNIEIGDRSRLGLDVDFGFGELYHTVYKLNANYRFSF